MERKVKKLEHSHVEVTVTVDSKSWKDAKEAAFRKLAKDVTIKGFRKGKAPENMVRSHVDQVKVMDDAINGLLPTIYADILKNENIRPYAQPKVDVTNISEDSITVKFTIVTEPEITLGKYKGLEIGMKAAKVTDKEVEAALEDLRKQNATLVVKKGVTALGDTVVMDFVGTVDGVAFEGGTAKNYELELGSHSFIPGFEEQLVGHKAGEHVVVKVTFPKQYTAELAGKDSEFACDIHEVKEKKLPELNDEFVKDLGLPNAKDVASLKASKKEELTKGKEAEAKREYLAKLYEAIAKDSKIDIPEEIIANQIDSMKKDINNRMAQSGLTLEQYLQIMGQTNDQFEANLKKDATRDVTNYLLIEKIAEKEKLNVTDADLDAEMKKIADQYKMKVEDVKKALAASLDEFRNNLKMNKTEALLLKENK